MHKYYFSVACVTILSQYSNRNNFTSATDFPYNLSPTVTVEMVLSVIQH